MTTYQIVGINFDHGHMNRLLSYVSDHPDADIVGLCDSDRGQSMASIDDAASRFHVPSDRCYDDLEVCLRQTDPDIVLLCPATGAHAEVVENVAPYDVHVILEKPFAASLADADRIIDAMNKTGNELLINWPLAWYPPHRTTKRLIDQGEIGTVTEIHYYDGNSGTPYPGPHPRRPSGRTTLSEEERTGPGSWFYREDAGGGSLLDYLGYGTTLATWFRDGSLPVEITTETFTPEGLPVDEQSISIARYEHGLSTFQTRWGTFTDPWSHQPQPKCGFVVCGIEGTISSWDYDDHITVQTESVPEGEDIPVDEFDSPYENPLQQLIHRLETGDTVHPPLSPALNRASQRIVDAAVKSAREEKTVSLPD